jgi:hypothetical protein
LYLQIGDIISLLPPNIAQNSTAYKLEERCFSDIEQTPTKLLHTVQDILNSPCAQPKATDNKDEITETCSKKRKLYSLKVDLDDCRFSISSPLKRKPNEDQEVERSQVTKSVFLKDGTKIKIFKEEKSSLSSFLTLLT